MYCFIYRIFKAKINFRTLVHYEKRNNNIYNVTDQIFTDLPPLSGLN